MTATGIAWLNATSNAGVIVPGAPAGPNGETILAFGAQNLQGMAMTRLKVGPQPAFVLAFGQAGFALTRVQLQNTSTTATATVKVTVTAPGSLQAHISETILVPPNTSYDLSCYVAVATGESVIVTNDTPDTVFAALSAQQPPVPSVAPSIPAGVAQSWAAQPSNAQSAPSMVFG